MSLRNLFAGIEGESSQREVQNTFLHVNGLRKPIEEISGFKPFEKG